MTTDNEMDKDMRYIYVCVCVYTYMCIYDGILLNN